jgi:hypothetical protein
LSFACPSWLALIVASTLSRANDHGLCGTTQTVDPAGAGPFLDNHRLVRGVSATVPVPSAHAGVADLYDFGGYAALGCLEYGCGLGAARACRNLLGHQLPLQSDVLAGLCGIPGHYVLPTDHQLMDTPVLCPGLVV